MKQQNKDITNENERNDFQVYTHIRPDTNEPFYVGKGIPGRAKQCGGRNKFWHNVVNKNKGIFKVEVLFKDMNEDDALKQERITELELRAKGYKLVNIVECGQKGGTSGRHCSDETKIKMSKTRKGAHLSKEHISKIIKSHLGIKLSEETKLKMSKSRKGIPKPKDFMNEKTRKKLSNTNKGRKGVNIGQHWNWPSISTKHIYQYNLNMEFIKEWDSAKQVKNITKIKIHECLAGRVKTAGGFKWKYKNK